MAKILVLYNTPSDAAAFDSYYRSTHTRIAKKLPGLISYTISAQTPRAIAGEAPHLVAELEFASMDAIEAALASPEAKLRPPTSETLRRRGQLSCFWRRKGCSRARRGL